MDVLIKYFSVIDGLVNHLSAGAWLMSGPRNIITYSWYYLAIICELLLITESSIGLMFSL